MAKSSKKNQQTPSEISTSSQAKNGLQESSEPSAAMPLPVRKTAAAKGAKTKSTPKKEPAANVPAPTKRRVRRNAEKKQPQSTEISEAAVRLRAYFISEWRQKNGVEGDSERDWIEAQRQLLAEANGNPEPAV